MSKFRCLFRLALATLLLEFSVLSPSLGQTVPVDEPTSVTQKLTSFRDKLKEKLWRPPFAQGAAARSSTSTQNQPPQKSKLGSSQSPVKQASHQLPNIKASPASFSRPEEYGVLEQIPTLTDEEELPPMVEPMHHRQQPLARPVPHQQPALAPPVTRARLAPQAPLENFSDKQSQRYEAPSTSQNQQRVGHYQNGNPRVETLLTGAQMTASQRALRLQAENQQLIEMRNSIFEENKRLNRLLSEKQEMLNRIESSIKIAQQQLAEASEKNQIQQKRIAELESENEKQVDESERLLDSIRTKLDDVLIREMTSK